MRKLIVASKNNGKIQEIKEILNDFDFEVFSIADVKIDVDVEETGTTFEQNALLKATEIHKLTRACVIADDSGLEVEYLNGAPGIYTARYAGETASAAQKNAKLLDALAGVPFEKRKAKFVCCVAVVFENGKSEVFRGGCEGYISEKPIGENGFGYDPIFYYPPLNCTTAQMTNEQKHQISHRGLALKKLAEYFKKTDSNLQEGIL